MYTLIKNNMLNLFKLNSREIKNSKLESDSKTTKHYPSSVREWNNSIYVYNKNTVYAIPSVTKSAIKMIKSYFSAFNQKLERVIRTRRLLLRLRRLSSNKIYLSNGEFKHTNNNVLINLYIFNRQKHNYISKLKKIYINRFLKKRDINAKIIKRLRIAQKKGLKFLILMNMNKYSFVKALNTLNNNKKYKVDIFKSLSKHTAKFYKNLLKKSLKKLQLYFIYKKLAYINKSKLNYTYLQSLKNHLENIYNKNVEFNLINLKRFYLNSDILSESITLKLTRNRRGLLKNINKIKTKVSKTIQQKSGVKLNLNYNNNKLNRYVISNLKHKYLTGFRLEAKGRLTRRYTASRSVSKLRYVGNLLDFNSSYKGLSSVILKGNLKSNLQYTKLSSKSRIGSFGIKGWVSSN